MALTDWMAAFQDRMLGTMHLPGAHDAGTTKDYIDKTKLGTDSNSATQNLTITQQLMIGTRFFDLRLAVQNKKVVAHHTTAGQGAYSKLSVDRVLQTAALWCGVHKSEVVIIRISHTSAATNAHEIAKESAKGALHTGTGNLCTKTLGEITGKGGGLVLIFDEEKFGTVINQAEGIHSFAKYKKTPANKRGISCCGVYEGSHKLEEVLKNGLKGQYQHNEEHSKRYEHLWQVYWQKTYKNPWSSRGIEGGTTKGFTVKDGKIHGGTHAATDHMLGLMKGHGVGKKEDYKLKKGVMFSTLPVRNYTLPNIISYDFVNEMTNQTIIDLNRKSVQSVSADDDGW